MLQQTARLALCLHPPGCHPAQILVETDVLDDGAPPSAVAGPCCDVTKRSSLGTECFEAAAQKKLNAKITAKKGEKEEVHK